MQLIVQEQGCCYIEEPVAAAIGAGIDIAKACGNMMSILVVVQQISQ